MNWEAISAVGQIVGAVDVIISVIYLVLQVRSNARLASMRSMPDAFKQWLYGLAGNSQIGDLYYRAIRDLQSIAGVDLLRFIGRRSARRRH